MSAKHGSTIGGNDKAELRESPAGEEAHAVRIAGDDNGADRTADERSEASNSLGVSPLSSRSGSFASPPCTSTASSRSTSSSSSRRPRRPRSQGSGCGSMAPMYSPVALTEEAATAAATAAAAAATFTAVHGDSCRRGAAGAADNLTEAAAERGNGGCQPESVGEDRAASMRRRRGVNAPTDAKETNATTSRDGFCSGRNKVPCSDKHGEEMPAVASDEEGHRLAVSGPPAGSGKENIAKKNGREAKPQLRDGNSDRRRGRGRPKGKSAHKQKETAADKGSGGGHQDGYKKEPTRPPKSDSPQHKDKASGSPPRSGWGSQRERGGSARSRSGSPRGRQRRRRRGTGHGGASDRKAQRPLEASEGTKFRGIGGVSGGAASDGYGTQNRKGEAEEVVAVREAGDESGPTEAELMLQALAGLSTALGRLSRAEGSTAGCVADPIAEQLRVSVGGYAEAGKGEGGRRFGEHAPGATAGYGDAENGILGSLSPALEMGAGGSLYQPTPR